jgi:hypothetical protein
VGEAGSTQCGLRSQNQEQVGTSAVEAFFAVEAQLKVSGELLRINTVLGELMGAGLMRRWRSMRLLRIS